MKRPCEMTPVEFRQHKNAIQRAWRRNNPEKARELDRKSAPYRKAWREKNRERMSKWRRKWIEANKEKVKKQQTEWQRKNKDKTTAYTYKWRSKNTERFKSYAKAYRIKNRKRLSEYRLKNRKANPERESRVRKLWESKNRGKVNAWSAIRRITVRGCPIGDVQLIKDFYQKAKSRKTNVCYYCKARFTEPPDIDHIVPISKGGKHAIENLCVSCEFCNASKKDRLVTEWKRNGQQVLPI